MDTYAVRSGILQFHRSTIEPTLAAQPTPEGMAVLFWTPHLEVLELLGGRRGPGV